MLGNGTGLNTLEDMGYLLTSAQKWTPHTGRVRDFRTHVQPFAGYSVIHIRVGILLVYKPRETLYLLGTRRPVPKDYVLPTHHHAYAWDVTSHSDVKLVVLTHVHFRS